MGREKHHKATPQEQLEELLQLYDSSRSNPGPGNLDQTINDRIGWLTQRSELFSFDPTRRASNEWEIGVLQYMTTQGAGTFRDALISLALKQVNKDAVSVFVNDSGTALGRTVTGRAIEIGYPELKRGLYLHKLHTRGYKK